MTKKEQRVTIDINKELWHQVGIESAKLGIYKKDFLEKALKEKIERINNEENHSEWKSGFFMSSIMLP